MESAKETVDATRKDPDESQKIRSGVRTNSLAKFFNFSKKRFLKTPYREYAYAVPACGRGLPSDLLKSGAGRLLAGRIYDEVGQNDFTVSQTQRLTIYQISDRLNSPPKKIFQFSSTSNRMNFSL